VFQMIDVVDWKFTGCCCENAKKRGGGNGGGVFDSWTVRPVNQ
jgi:hypothetical protein